MKSNRVVRALLGAYAVGSVPIAAALFLGLPGTGDLSGTASGQLLAAALLALAFGAAVAVRDPWQHRVIVQIIIAFTVMATVVVTLHVQRHSFHSLDRSWVLVPLVAACPILLGLFYPRPARE